MVKVTALWCVVVSIPKGEATNYEHCNYARQQSKFQSPKGRLQTKQLKKFWTGQGSFNPQRGGYKLERWGVFKWMGNRFQSPKGRLQT
ncbi:hypothetical protein Calla_2422 [Caldicellulosiruptor acetigenus 6A]|uniref:Uncharacterized protein n=1 Tax=Caldicellulosiruptor acetigenus 6A TaxID=632516 RepID=G2PYM9_9FIRM|nr:hypothetical protein Calla_2422 [Caldicellulosiruptor acetigenus 6A]